MASDAKGTVLVVDDHEDTADMLALLLEGEGFAVEVARSGSEAVVKALEAKPLLVLMDLQLPDASGVEVGKLLRAALPTSKIVAVTGYPLPRIQEELSSAGFDDAVQKPVDISRLRKLLRDASDRGGR